MSQDLAQINEVVKYELDKANVNSLLSELAQKVVQITNFLEQNR